MEPARREYEKVVSKTLVDRGLRTIPPPSADHKFMPGDFVCVYREGVKHYRGPYLVASISGKQVRLHVGERTGPREFNISQLRPAPLTRLKSFDETYINSEPGEHCTLHTEVLNPRDQRIGKFASQLDDAMRQEIVGLIEKGTFRLVMQEEMDPNPNIVPSRFVLALKHSETGEIKFKALFVLGGHRDKAKGSIVYNTVNLKQSSIRLLMAIATILSFDVWSLDVKQAYLQSASQLQTKVYIIPDQLNLAPDEFLQIVLPLYALSDIGDYWCETFAKFYVHNLRMQQTTGDFDLFFRRCTDQLVALSGCYVDDVLQSSKPEIKKEIQRQLKEHFDITLSDASQFTYTGIICDSSNPQSRILSQTHYIKRLNYLPLTATFTDFRSLRAKLMWVVHTRPDIACGCSMAAQITANSFNGDSIKVVNRIIKHLKRTPTVALQFSKLDVQSLRLVVYADSSFMNLPDLESQLGFITCLADETGKCSILHYSSHKSRLVARSSMAAETLAFTDAFDSVYLIRHDLQRLLNRYIPVLMFTDSKLLFDVLTRSRYTTELRLMVDIAAAREAYLEHTISNIGLIVSEHNPADSLTKIDSNQALRKLTISHKIDHPV